MSIAEYSLLVLERLGCCDACLAAVRREPETDLGDLLCDRCLVRLDTFIDALRAGDSGALKTAKDCWGDCFDYEHSVPVPEEWKEEDK